MGFFEGFRKFILEDEEVVRGQVINFDSYRALSILTLQSELGREDVYFFDRLDEGSYLGRFVVITNVKKGFFRRRLEQLIETGESVVNREFRRYSKDYSAHGVCRSYDYLVSILSAYLNEQRSMFSPRLI